MDLTLIRIEVTTIAMMDLTLIRIQEMKVTVASKCRSVTGKHK
jgi:hypothetical protein